MPEPLRFQLEGGGAGMELAIHPPRVPWMACLERLQDWLARSVDEALLRVERQRERIAEMVQAGQPTKGAEDLLSMLVRLFADMVELEHRTNAMLQPHNNVACELSTFED